MAKIFKKIKHFQSKPLFIPAKQIKPYNDRSDVEALNTNQDVEDYLQDDFTLEDYSYEDTRLSTIAEDELTGDIIFMFKDKRYKAEWHLEEEFFGYQSGYYCHPVIDKFYEI
jgi:hypothetical protein